MTLQGNGRSRSFWRDFFIDVASIPGVGPARKAALRSLVLKQPQMLPVVALSK
ncbi:hypothetical protein HTZ85_21870 [Escherichia coli]|nr:hypothetical protein [Escherichia coli]